MSTRITNGMLVRSVLADLTTVDQRLSLLQRKLSSTKEITKPSDDPYGAGRAMALRGELEATSQYKRNVREALGWASVTDTALSKIGDLAQRARELIVRGANDQAQTSRDAIAEEIDQLADAMKQEASTTYDGRYVLGGTRTDIKPYTMGSDLYAGDSGAIVRQLGPGVALGVGVRGDEVLGGSATATGDLLRVMRDVAAHLRAGDGASLGTIDLQDMQGQIDHLLGIRARVGATANRLETAGTRLAELEESTMQLLSETEDADIASTLVAYSTQKSVYQAALRSGADLVQMSLLDFLR
ncbi:MAG: flagellar hook-associated protein FlgL [Solirubrobacteraceae bacterium]|nr:flagellar hook-associated protein FlgL [Solirubrobacteraceae bacterium]